MAKKVINSTENKAIDKVETNEPTIAILQVVPDNSEVTVIGTKLFEGHEGKEFVVSGNVANALLHVKKVVLK